MADPLPDTGRGRSEDQSRGRTGMLTFITVAVIVAALYFAREVLVPFALAILLSFLLMPAVRLLRRVRAGRVTSVGITVLIAFLAIFAFGAIVTQEISLLGPELPRYQHNIEFEAARASQSDPASAGSRSASPNDRDAEAVRGDRHGADSAKSKLQ